MQECYGWPASEAEREVARYYAELIYEETRPFYTEHDNEPDQ